MRQNDEMAAIARAVDTYADGLHQGSVATLKKVFRPEAIVAGYIGGEMFIKPVGFLYEFVEENLSPAKKGEPFTCTRRSIAIESDAASVWVTERDYLGVDYETNLQLLKIGAQWWIVSKLFRGTPKA